MRSPLLIGKTESGRKSIDESAILLPQAWGEGLPGAVFAESGSAEQVDASQQRGGRAAILKDYIHRERLIRGSMSRRCAAGFGPGA